MTIIILEGVNGTGKSARAAALAKKFAIPIVRLWRGDPAVHLGREDGGLMERLRAIGVPANHWIEDVIVTEALVAADADAILDRSLPSGLAYGRMYGEATEEQAEEAWKIWTEKLATYTGAVLYLYLTARYETVRGRLEGRWCPTLEQYEQLERAYRRAYWRFTGGKTMIRTDDTAQQDIDLELFEAISHAHPR